jgi:hypothetical protein
MIHFASNPEQDAEQAIVNVNTNKALKEMKAL